MLSLIMTFDLVHRVSQDARRDDPASERTRGSLVRVEQVSDLRRLPDHRSRATFDLDNVDRLHLSDDRTIDICWASGLFGPDGDPRVLADESRDVALIVPFQRRPLVCRTEPTLDDRVGVVIENMAGKTLFVGIGDVLPAADGAGYEFCSFGKEVYSWRQASPSGCAHTNWAKKKK